jgi:alpha-L-rhamnosidase
MISPVDDFAGAPLLRAEFALDDGHGAVVSAELAVSSLGVFEAYLNGRAVGHDVLSPGWSSYEWRLRYRTYDVTDLLRPATVLGISLGNGWSRGRLGWNGNRALYGDRLAVIAQLEVAYADGHRQLVITDETWRAGPSATLANDLYDGQTIDARLADGTWMHAGAAPPGWGSVETLEFDTSRLTPYIGPPVVRHETLRPVNIWSAPSGRMLVDFGQNPSAGCAAPSRVRPGPRSSSGTARSSSTASLTRGHFAAPRPPTVSSCPAARTTSSPRRPTTASDTPR